MAHNIFTGDELRAIALFSMALSVVTSNWQGFSMRDIICLSGQECQIKYVLQTRKAAGTPLRDQPLQGKV
jgi:hypothetical protein